VREPEVSPRIPAWLGLALVALAMAIYIAGYAWSVPHTDTADELVHAYAIRHGLAYPAEGPFLGRAAHFGPFWFYLTALPLFVRDSWLAAALFIGFVCALKFPLAYHCGKRVLDRDFGVLWAIALLIPGWSSIEEICFLNPNAVDAAVLAVVALCLHGLAAPWRMRHFFVLGLAAGLAMHVHPTAIPVFLLAIPVFARQRREWRASIARGTIAAAIGFVLPFVPYLASQAMHGFPDVHSATGYFVRDISIANIVHAPAILFGYVTGGPAAIARYLAGWSEPAAHALGAVFGIALVVSLLALGSATGRRAWLAFTASFVAFGAWLACMRPTTPAQFTWVLLPSVAGLLALGLWALLRYRGARPLVAMIAIASVALNAYFVAAIARTVEGGESALPSSVLDVGGGSPGHVFRDVWFPAYRHAALGEFLCASAARRVVHGHLAYVVDKDLGLDTLFSCGDRASMLLLSTMPGTHVFGMTHGFWQALAWSPECWIGSLGIERDAVPLVRRDAMTVADGSTYLAREPADRQAELRTESFEAPSGSALLVTNVLGGYEGFAIESASVDGRPAMPIASNDLSALYGAPAPGGNAPAHWTFAIRTTRIAGVEILAVANHRGSPHECALASARPAE